jgi:hypothetical protein
MYLAMAQSHLDTAQNHVKIAEGGQELSKMCERYKEKEQKKVEKKVGDHKVEKR